MKTNSVGRSSQAASEIERHQASHAGSRNPQLIQGSHRVDATTGTAMFGKADLSIIMQTDPSLCKSFLHLLSQPLSFKHL